MATKSMSITKILNYKKLVLLPISQPWHSPHNFLTCRWRGLRMKSLKETSLRASLFNIKKTSSINLHNPDGTPSETNADSPETPRLVKSLSLASLKDQFMSSRKNSQESDIEKNDR